MTACDVTPDMPVAGGLRWRTGARIELVAGYRLHDPVGNPVEAMDDVTVAVEGGFVHVVVPGAADVQVMSAPAIRRIAYR